MSFFKVRINSFKALAAVILFALSAYLLNQCEKEKAQVRSYPQVRTNPVSGITSNGATFSAEIYSLGSEPITDHGFVWVQGKSPDLSNDKILLGPTGDAGTYSSDIKTSLAKDAEYTVKSFVKTSEHIVYGLPVTFVSLGSGAPTVTGFEPDSAAWMDTLILSGTNFAMKKEDNIVKLNQVQCNVLEVSNTSVKILISKDLADLKSVVSVEQKGNRNIFIQDTFRLIAPRVTTIVPDEAAWRDEITVSGQHFESEYFINSITARIGNYPASITSRDNTHLTVVVPDDLASLENELKITFNKFDVVISPGLKLKAPFISGISPKEGTWNSVITLLGKFHPSKNKNNITIGGFSADIISNSSDSIKVIAPVYLVDHKNLVINNIPPFEVKCLDTFKLKPPEIDSIIPLTGSSATPVYISGKYLRSVYTLASVMFGNTESAISGNSEELIQCYVPPALTNGPLNVTITVGHQSATYKYPFNVQNPVVTSVTPSTGTFDDPVTIQGFNLILEGEIPEVYFGSYDFSTYGPVVSATANSITATVPRYLDSIPRNIVLRYFNKGLFINTSESFVLAPPVITSVSPPTLIPGQTITISGNNFNPDANKNTVYWSTIPLTVTGSSKTQITVTVPEYLPRGSERININVGGYKRSFSQLFVYNNSPWAIVPVPSNLEWAAFDQIGQAGVSFATGGKGYIMDYNGMMNSFDPSSGTFTGIGNFQEYSGLYDEKCITINDTALLFAGNLGFLRFDAASAQWIKIGSLPTTTKSGAYAFEINGRLFFGGNTENWTRYLWEYVRSTNTWISRTDNTSRFYPYAVGSFVYNNKGYVLFLDNILSSYDPVSNTWTDMSPFPGPARVDGRMTFLIDDKFYVGLGPGLTDFYRYDPSTDTWAQISPMPGLGRYNTVSFVLNRKAYIGFGFTTPGGNVTLKMNDFYEFDPNYPSK